ncbi:hypothetical protein [Streptomyces flavofungini]|uniref:hypothetical protein n=1 Tax=Streptomyces flavofungini TaxID=68200 RepID=UPI0034DEB399
MARQTTLHDVGTLRFDARAQVDPAEVRSVREAVRDSGIEHLYVVVHGAHNDESVTRDADSAFHGMLADAWADAAGGAGCLTVQWPSLCFRDEGVWGIAQQVTEQERAGRPGISKTLYEDLLRHLPDGSAPLAEIAELLREQPPHDRAFDDLGSALRRLAEIPLQDPLAEYAADTEGEILPQSDPLMLFEDTKTVCGEFAGALSDLMSAAEDQEPGESGRQEDGAGASGAEASDGETPDAEVSEEGTLPEIRVAGHRPTAPRSDRVNRVGTVATGGPVGLDRHRQGPAEVWRGAHELFRQVVRHVLRRRAGAVGQAGLGPCLSALVESSETRIHLVGHGLGGRLAGFALRGLEARHSESVTLASLTLLQAEMSHFVFADSLPQQVSGHGALWNQRRLVQGPLICTFSHLDTHLGVLYPLSAQMIGDSAEMATTARKWGALGFDGIQGVDGPPDITLDALNEMSARDLSKMPYTNVDASSLFRSADVPMGGHHHVIRPEVGRLLRKVAESPAALP